MRILIINLDKSIFKPGSLSLENLKDYSRFFDKLFVISWTRGEEKPIFFEDRLFVYPTNSRSRLFYILDTYKIFKNILKNERIDLVSSQDPFETGFVAFLISRIFEIPLHLQIHTDVFSPEFIKQSMSNKLRAMMAKFLITKAQCIRVVSERIKNSLISKYRNIEISKIVVLPIYVDVKKIREAPVNIDLHKKYPQFEFIILMASRLAREKNIGLAIEAMEEIIKKYPKIGLIIVGSGSEDKNLKSQIFPKDKPTGQANLKSNVIFEGWQDDIISYYKTADLFLLTSNYEGYGMAVVEAMTAGLAVIMTDVGLAGEVLIDKKDGIVVPVGNKRKLTEAILNLIENRALRVRLIENSRKTLDFWPDRGRYLRAYRESWLICR